MSGLAIRAGSALLLLGLAACGGTFGRRSEPTEDRAALAASIVALRQQVTVQELELARLRERIAALEARRPAGPVPAAPPSPPPSSAASPEASEPKYPAPRFEDADLPAPPAPSLPATATATATAQELYDQAYALIQQGKHSDAEVKMQHFLATYGATDLADNAAYWIGEARYSRSDWQGAFEAFKSAVERYPEGNKAADSLFKVGKCLEKLGDREGAREVLTEVVSRFPATAAAAAADEALRALR